MAAREPSFELIGRLVDALEKAESEAESAYLIGNNLGQVVEGLIAMHHALGAVIGEIEMASHPDEPLHSRTRADMALVSIRSFVEIN